MSISAVLCKCGHQNSCDNFVRGYLHSGESHFSALKKKCEQCAADIVVFFRGLSIVHANLDHNSKTIFEEAA